MICGTESPEATLGFWVLGTECFSFFSEFQVCLGLGSFDSGIASEFGEAYRVEQGPPSA